VRSVNVIVNVIAIVIVDVIAPVSASADEGHDFADEARALFRAAACGGDSPIPTTLDKKTIDDHCAILKPQEAAFKRRWVDVAHAFFVKLAPTGLPTRAVYPFGGGDLISALATFPDASEITTLSLEPAGDPRPIDKIDPTDLAASLQVNRSKIIRLFHVGHSLTTDLSTVSRRNRLPGELIYALVGLATLGYEPVSLRYFRIDPSGDLHYWTDSEIAAADQDPGKRAALFANMELRFKQPGASGATRIHRHIGANLDDKHLRADSSLLKHLEAKGRVVAMTKAASYLLWFEDFSLFRNYLLKNMDWMASDSTGVPPHFAVAAGFAQDTYGQFEGPLRRLHPGKVESDEFRKLWDANPRRVLPFRYGYPDSAKHPHLIVTRRKH